MKNSAVLCIVACTFFSSTASARVWTDTEGRAMEAQFVSSDGVTVTVRMPNNTIRTLNLDTLSAVDEVFVKEWLKKHPPKKKPGPPVKPATPATPAPDKPVAPGPSTPPPTPGTTPGTVAPGTTTPGATTPGTTTPPKAPIGGAPANGSTGPVGFDGDWPASAFVPDELNIEVVKEDDANKIYVYRSTHFEFTCDVQLRTRLVSACAKIFEATHEMLRLLPLNNRSTGGKKKLFPVTLFEEFSDYVKAGGPPGSAGVCMYSSNSDAKVLVPLESMGVKKVGKDYTVDSNDRDYRVLSHEITHQIMEHEVKQASWYIEGSAEYSAYTPYTGGRYKVGVNKSSIVASVTAYGKKNEGGRALGENIKMPRLETFMTLPYDRFVYNAGFNYGVACLLTYYWYHQDGNGDAARIKEYLKALQSRTPESKARELLLAGRTWEQLETDFAKAMRRLGVRIEYKG